MLFLGGGDQFGCKSIQTILNPNNSLPFSPPDVCCFNKMMPIYFPVFPSDLSLPGREWRVFIWLTKRRESSSVVEDTKFILWKTQGIKQKTFVVYCASCGRCFTTDALDWGMCYKYSVVFPAELSNLAKHFDTKQDLVIHGQRQKQWRSL